MASILRVRNLQSVIRRFTSESLTEQKAIEKHATDTANTWKMVSFFVGLPTCGYLFYKHIIQGEEHHGGKEWIPYDHMRIRHTPFPWGDESLFHSKHNVGPNTPTEEEEEAPKENFITAFMRKLRDDHVKRDWQLQVESMEFCHQKMMEHIERKKFVYTPPLPRYSRLFGLPRYDLHNDTYRLPAGMDD